MSYKTAPESLARSPVLCLLRDTSQGQSRSIFLQQFKIHNLLTRTARCVTFLTALRLFRLRASVSVVSIVFSLALAPSTFAMEENSSILSTQQQRERNDSILSTQQQNVYLGKDPAGDDVVIVTPPPQPVQEQTQIPYIIPEVQVPWEPQPAPPPYVVPTKRYRNDSYHNYRPNRPHNPNRPNRPGYPAHPGYPGYPNHPNYPHRPDYPNYPNRPNRPDYPNYPNYPNRPDYPNYPNRPNYPDYPNYPSSPSYPVYPGGPGSYPPPYPGGNPGGYPPPGWQPGYPGGGYPPRPPRPMPRSESDIREQSQQMDATADMGQYDLQYARVRPESARLQPSVMPQTWRGNTDGGYTPPPGNNLPELQPENNPAIPYDENGGTFVTPSPAL